MTPDWGKQLVEARTRWFKIDSRGFVAKDEEGIIWVCCGRFWVNFFNPSNMNSSFGRDWDLDIEDPSSQGALEGLLYEGLQELFGKETSFSISCRKGEWSFQFGNQEINSQSRGQMLAQALYVVMEAVQRKKEQILDKLEEQGHSIHNAKIAAKMVW